MPDESNHKSSKILLSKILLSHTLIKVLNVYVKKIQMGLYLVLVHINLIENVNILSILHDFSKMSKPLILKVDLIM